MGWPSGPFGPCPLGSNPGQARFSLGLSVGLTKKRPQEPQPTTLLEPIALRAAELNHQVLLCAWGPEMPPPSLPLPNPAKV